MKAWLKQRAPVAYPNTVEIIYSGGDPRIIIVRHFEEKCYRNGELIDILRIQEYSEEVKINTYSAEMIEEYLATFGILPIVSEPKVQEQ